jgi:hypothetical protein
MIAVVIRQPVRGGGLIGDRRLQNWITHHTSIRHKRAQIVR